MNAKRHALGGIVLFVAVAVALPLAGLSGCKGEQKPAPTPAGKPAAKPAAEEMLAVVNAACPIMGNPIDPKAVMASLTRTYEGKVVGFCCAGCPVAWDKLGDKEKGEKLAAAMKPATTPAME
ncbi:MAG TPA: hypothetical protein VM695_15025 [Phycisphaerae bacterium]|nr:hypothetical protein [Phycisphaerae bacterium]